LLYNFLKNAIAFFLYPHVIFCIDTFYLCTCFILDSIVVWNYIRPKPMGGLLFVKLTALRSKNIALLWACVLLALLFYGIGFVRIGGS
jgi:hypothetical protein